MFVPGPWRWFSRENTIFVNIIIVSEHATMLMVFNNFVVQNKSSILDHDNNKHALLLFSIGEG